MNNKTELLEQLKIDKQDKMQPDKSAKTNWVVVFFALLVGGGLGYYLAGQQVNTAGAAEVKAEQATKPPAASENSSSTQANTTRESSHSAAAEPSNNSSHSPAKSQSILNASGYITARRMATVSSEVMGLITQVNVEEGMAVEKGQILAELDSALIRVALDMAKAQVQVSQARFKSIQANLNEAKRNLVRLKNNQFSSEAELSFANADVERLDANLTSAQADIKVAQIEVKRQQERLADYTIRAPFTGIVTMKNAQPGEIVSPASAGGGFTRTGICTIVDMGSLEIEVDVNESFIGRVYPGQPVEAKLDAYSDWRIPASVIAIIPTADRAKATVQVRIKLETEDSRILPDMGVKVAFMK